MSTASSIIREAVVREGRHEGEHPLLDVSNSLESNNMNRWLYWPPGGPHDASVTTSVGAQFDRQNNRLSTSAQEAYPRASAWDIASGRIASNSGISRTSSGRDAALVDSEEDLTSSLEQHTSRHSTSALQPNISTLCTLPKPLPIPEDFKRDGNLIRERYQGITTLRADLCFKKRDSSTASMYRMCEFLCADESNQLMLEMQYFWNQAPLTLWSVSMIPDPCDENVERSAILASLVESLYLAFTYRHQLGLRRPGASGCAPPVDSGKEDCPTWTEGVPRLCSTLVLCDMDPIFLIDQSNPFTKRNIVANAGNIFSI